jgi:formylglycine-generating enzyme required for sulfatase activity
MSIGSRRRSNVIVVAALVVTALGLAFVANVAVSAGPDASVSSEPGNCTSYSGLPAGDGETAGMVFIPGGAFQMGSDRDRPEERYAHSVRVDSFWIDRHEVTNAQFRKFVEATGYVTLAERALDPKAHPGMPKELLAPGSVVFIKPTNITRGGNLTQWWRYIAGANWRHPTGPGSSIAGKDNHPVVHIAYEDAQSYARWRGRSLPTEAQWEFAVLGGRDAGEDWSKPVDADGKATANTWQGIFPVFNSNDDGYEGTAPVGCFKPNGYGLQDMLGNVWEWTNDWYRPGHAREPAANPAGPDLKLIRLAPGQSVRRVIKGGSHLCALNYCARYRPAARQPQEVDLGAAHLGFRTVLRPVGKE